MSEKPYTGKGLVVAEIVKGNPAGRLKAVEFGAYGELRRVEWHEDPQAAPKQDGEASEAATGLVS